MKIPADGVTAVASYAYYEYNCMRFKRDKEEEHQVSEPNLTEDTSNTKISRTHYQDLLDIELTN